MTLSEIETQLKQLPDTAAGIADFLIGAGITGVRQEPTCCPVARWLRRELEVPYASVAIDLITVVDADGGMYEINTPSWVGRFMTTFDDQYYPELVDMDGPTEEELHTIESENDPDFPEPDLMESQYV